MKRRSLLVVPPGGKSVRVLKINAFSVLMLLAFTVCGFAACGWVSLCENDPAWGRRLVIDHAGSISTVYAHLGSVKTATGRNVRKGEVVGFIGLSGQTTGPHLHYEIRRNGVPADPGPFFFPFANTGG